MELIFFVTRLRIAETCLRPLSKISVSPLTVPDGSTDVSIIEDSFLFHECFLEGYAFSSEPPYFDTPFTDNEDIPTFSFVRPVEEQETEQFSIGSTEDQSDLPNFKPWTDSWGSGDALHENADFFEIFLGGPSPPETAVHADQLPIDPVSRAFVAIWMKQYSSCSESRYPRLVRVGTYQRYSGL